MFRNTRAWLVVASLFTLINAVGAGYAAAEGEGLHASSHAGLMLLGTYLVWRLATRAARSGFGAAALPDARLEQLQQAVDVVAVEVERIGEAQRFSVKQQAEQVETRR